MEPVYGWKDIGLQRGSNSRPALNSLKVDETEKTGELDNSLVYFRWHTYQDYLKYKPFLAVPGVPVDLKLSTGLLIKRFWVLGLW